MHDNMMKLLMKKKKEGKELSDSDKNAKLQALKEMKDVASGMMSDKLKGLKKVTVASPDEEGLQKGLEKAQELVGSEEEESSDEENPSMNPEESPSESEYHEAMGDMEDMYLKKPESPEEIDALIAELQAKKEEMQKS